MSRFRLRRSGLSWARSARGSFGDVAFWVRRFKHDGDASEAPAIGDVSAFAPACETSPVVIAAQRDGQQDKRHQLDCGDGGDQGG